MTSVDMHLQRMTKYLYFLFLLLLGNFKYHELYLPKEFNFSSLSSLTHAGVFVEWGVGRRELCFTAHILMLSAMLSTSLPVFDCMVPHYLRSIYHFCIFLGFCSNGITGFLLFFSVDIRPELLLLVEVSCHFPICLLFLKMLST